jgi:hypothetical protein
MTTLTTPAALHYRDGAWTPGPDPVADQMGSGEDWLDTIASAGFHKRPFAIFGGPHSSSYAEMFAGLDGASFFMAVTHGSTAFSQHFYFHSTADALDHAARWAPAFALQRDEPELTAPMLDPGLDADEHGVDAEELAALRQAPHP